LIVQVVVAQQTVIQVDSVVQMVVIQIVVVQVVVVQVISDNRHAAAQIISIVVSVQRIIDIGGVQ
jgi:hypothetical protein